MKEHEEKKQWVLCPWCGSKTRLQIFRETFLCSARSAGTRASSTLKILSSRPNSQTLRRSADRKADHALRLTFLRGMFL